MRTPGRPIRRSSPTGKGCFSLPAQFEQYTLVAIHDDGYAELNREPNQQPGELTLKAWARVEGRLLKAGQPVPSVWIFFESDAARDPWRVTPHPGRLFGADRPGRPLRLPTRPAAEVESERESLGLARVAPHLQPVCPAGPPARATRRNRPPWPGDLGQRQGRSDRRRRIEDRPSQVAQLACSQGARHRAAARVPLTRLRRPQRLERRVDRIHRRDGTTSRAWTTTSSPWTRMAGSTSTAFRPATMTSPSGSMSHPRTAAWSTRSAGESSASRSRRTPSTWETSRSMTAPAPRPARWHRTSRSPHSPARP